MQQIAEIMNSDPTHEEAPSCCAETWTLERLWYEGALLRHVDGLLRFAEMHSDEISPESGGFSDPARAIGMLHRLIDTKGTVDLPCELRDQARQITNEIWYRGERGEFDRKRIQMEWTQAHAGAWRTWRMKEYHFVADRCAHQIVRHLRRMASEAQPG